MKAVLHRTQRILLAAVIALLLLVAASVAALRYWFLPNVEDYRPRIAHAASGMLGQKVEIGAIAVGWRGLRLHLVLHDVAVLDAESRPALNFAKVETTLAWLPLLSREVDLKSLALDGPRLVLERDQQGAIRVTGMQGEGDGGFTNWLLSQDEVIVRDAVVSWHDRLRQAPLLEFTDVDLVLTNSGRNHKLGVHASPPQGIASRIDFRADVDRRSLADTSDWGGRLYADVQAIDVAQARRWLDLPAQLKEGVAGGRVWASFRNWNISEVTADVTLKGAKVQLAEHLPASRLANASGRLSWESEEQGFGVRADKMALMLEGSAEPINVSFNFSSPKAKEPAEGEIRVDELDIRSVLAIANSLAAKTPDEIRSATPQGRLRNVAVKWRGDWKTPAQYEGAMDFLRLSFAPQGKLPGGANLSGSVKVDERGGTLKLDSRGSAIELPLIFRERLQFDRLFADLAWTRRDEELELDFRKLDFANADAEGTASGVYRTTGQDRGYADFAGQLTRADASAVWRYMPLRIGAATRDWLQTALVAGHSDDVRFRLKGNLANFPFSESTDEVFEVTAKAKNGTVKYANDWPPLENVNGDVKFHGKRMEVSAKSASLAGARIGNVRAEIPDLIVKDELLEVKGDAEGPTSRFLAFIENSPVADMIDRFTRGITAEGGGALEIKIAIPLRHREDTEIDGVFTFNDNVLSVPDLPTASGVNGRLKFTESTATLEPTSAVVLGGPINVSASGKEGAGVTISASGRTDVENLKKAFAQPLLAHLRGTADWRGSLELKNKLSSLALESDLRGIAIDLPAPFRKSEAEAVELRIERTQPSAGRDHIALTYGAIASLRAQRNLERKEVERAALAFGNPAVLPERRSITVTGKLTYVDIDEWKNLLPGSGATSLPDRSDIDLRIATLSTGKRDFNALRIVATSQGGDWTATLKGDGVSGAVAWKPGTPKGTLTARFSELTVPDSRDESPGKSPFAANDMPAVDAVAENFTINGKRFGKMELVGMPENQDWRIEKLNFSSPEGGLESQGIWFASPARTELKLKLIVKDIGAYLARYNYPEGVKNGSAEIEGRVSWPGSPMDFGFAKLDGNLILVAKDGRFVKLRPGLGKLLGLVSLQALPRRIKLDFKDIFSQGFEFDTIAGELRIANGVMSTDDFTVRGTSGRIIMKGDVHLEDEVQDLAVKITPTLGDTVAIAAAIANPIAGVATYIASKVLKDPLDQFLSYEYAVRGSWDEPVVTKTSRAPEAPHPFGAQ